MNYESFKKELEANPVLARNFQETLIKFIKQIQEDSEIIRKGCKRLAEYGWTLHFNWDFPQIGCLLDVNSKEELDYIMYKYYCRNNRELINDLLDSFTDKKYDCLTRWDSLLIDCISIYKNKIYKPIIPSLVSIIDGLVAMQCGNKSKTSRLLQFCTKQIEKNNGDIIWTSILEFLNVLFEPNDFNGPRPLSLNRHWIQHGRDICDEWTEVDTIRLFVSLDCIAYVIDEMKKCEQ